MRKIPVFGFVTAKQMIRCELTCQQMKQSSERAIAIWNTRQKWRSGKNDDWQRGQFSSPWLSHAIGLRGEIAFREMLGVYLPQIPTVDFGTHRKPNASDFVFDSTFGKKHEVKTTVNRDLFSVNYVRADHVERNDVFWFMCVRELDSPNFVLRGFVTRDELQSRGTKKSGRGKWENYVIETEMLNPVSQFVREQR